MAFTANTLNIQPIPSNGVLFYKSLYIADLTGCEDIAALVAGHSHYLTRIVAHTATAMAVTVGSGETTSAPTTIHIGPVPFDSASGFLHWKSPDGMGLKCTSGAALTMDSDTAGAIWVYVEGKTCVDNIK